MRAIGAMFAATLIASAAAADTITVACDAIVFKGQLDAATQTEMEPVHTLDAIAAILTRHNVSFQRMRKVPLRLHDITPATEQWLATMPTGEPFVLPNQNSGTICVMATRWKRG